MRPIASKYRERWRTLGHERFCPIVSRLDQGVRFAVGKFPSVHKFNPLLIQYVPKNFTGRDFFSYKPEHIEWLEERGCRWVFPDVGPGDLIFWDSRTAHWAASPEMGRPRIAVCKYHIATYIFLSLQLMWIRL